MFVSAQKRKRVAGSLSHILNPSLEVLLWCDTLTPFDIEIHSDAGVTLADLRWNSKGIIFFKKTFQMPEA